MRILLVLLSSLLLSACVGGNLISSPFSKQDPSAQARQLAEQGAYREAAYRYLDLAESSVSSHEQRARWQMEAVDLFIRAHLFAEAKAQLLQIRSDDPLLRTRARLAQAQLMTAEQQDDNALELLKQIDPQQLPRAQQRQYHEARARALEARQEPLAALYERIRLDTLLSGDFEQRANQQALWQDLLRLTPTQLKQARQPRLEGLEGWLALALLVKTAPPAQLDAALQRWQTGFTRHPASAYILPSLQRGQLRQAPAGPQLTSPQPQAEQHIALLLPLSGHFTQAAARIRDGFVAAWYAQSSQGRVMYPVKIYNTGNGHVVDAYQRALEQGAQWVVGPLEKNDVSDLLQAYPQQLPAPTLVLNDTDTQGRPFTARANLLLFSLAPEAEAKAVAQRAWADGYRMAGAVVPAGQWGQRVLEAFRQQWNALGGQMGSVGFYEKNDYSASVKQVARDRQVDMSFVLAYPKAARQIRPQFKYHYAASLPLYASSHVYGGSPDPDKDYDLDGIRFVDMPWVLQQGELRPLQQAEDPLYAQLQQQWPERLVAGERRLLAFGVDAYRLTHYVQQYGLPDTHLRLQGATGNLHIDAQGVVQRDLTWAEFNNGVPRLIPDDTIPPMVPAQPGAPASATYPAR